jgi:ABC-type nitrate/sulfonate/bicarbonate transport system substrate-binding protein
MYKSVVAVALAAAVAVVQPARAQQEETSLALPALTITFTPVYVAADAGLWAKHGLNVKLQDISGLGSTNAMLAGSVDFAVGSGPTVIRANIRGQKIIGVALMANGVAFETVMRPEATGGLTRQSPLADRARSFRGKKIMVDNPNTIVHAFLRYIARKGGVDPEREITVVSMQPAAALAALKSGAIDGGTFTLPWSHTAVRQGNVLMATGYGDVPELLPFGSTATLTRPGFCEQKPSICTKLVAGYKEAHAFVHDRQAEAIEILKKRMPTVDPADLAGAYAQMKTTTPRSPGFTEEGFMRAQTLMLEGGMIKPEEKLSSFKDIYTNAYVR